MTKKEKKQKKIIRIVSVVMAMLVLLSTFAVAFSSRAFAAPQTIPNDTRPVGNETRPPEVITQNFTRPNTPVTQEPEIVVIPGSKPAEETTSKAEETNTQPSNVPATEPVTEPSTEGVTEPPLEIETLTVPNITVPQTQAEKKDKYTILLSLIDTNPKEKLLSKEITITIRKGEDGEKQKLVFTKKNYYSITTELAPGTYDIIKVKSNDKYVTPNLLNPDGSAITQITVIENDAQNNSIQVDEVEMNFWLQMVARNWLYAVIAIVLAILLRFYKQKRI